MELKKLYEMINFHFNEEDIQLLCFSLSPQIDFESLAGNTKPGKIRELIEYCRRYGRLDELINYCQDSRPNVDWFNSLASTQSTTEQLSAPIFNESELKSLMGFIDWRQSREGYLYSSAISKLKEKLREQLNAIESKSNYNSNLSSIELSLLLETVNENIQHIQDYDYIGMSISDAKRQRDVSMKPLIEFRKRLYMLAVEAD